jgi:head-tail adaptor
MKPFQGQTAFTGAGEFRDRITIQSRILNAGGDEVTGYSVFAQSWANVEPAIVPAARNRNIQYASGREISLFDVLIRLRFLPGIDTTMTVLHGTITYQIRDVADVASLGRELHLICRIVR